MNQMTIGRSYSLDNETDKRDILNRQPLVEHITNIINTISESKGTCTLALNGEWGSGKTFLLEMIEKVLKNQYAGKNLVFKYNCWQYDFYEEPLVALVASLLDSIRDYKKILPQESIETISLVLNVALEVFGKFMENTIGFNPVEHANNALDITEEENNKRTKFDTYSDLKEGINSLRTALETLAKKYTIIVVVDEVDRCIPPYAIKVLERLHHLLGGIPNLVVLIAVDKKQLDHSIRQLFGAETNTEKYLQKFINFEIKVDYGSVNEGYIEKFNDYISLFGTLPAGSTFNFNRFVSALFCGIDIRQIERIMEKIRIAHRVIYPTIRKDYSFMCFELICGVLDLFYELDSYGRISISPTNNNSIEYSFQYQGGGTYTTQDYPRFIDYLNEECTFDVHEVILLNDRYYSSDSCDIPQILVYYLDQIICGSNVSGKYRINADCPNLDRIKSNVQELIRFREFLNLIQ